MLPQLCRCWRRSGELASALEGGATRPGGLSSDMAVQCQRLSLDVVGLVAFSHDFEQVAHAAR